MLAIQTGTTNIVWHAFNRVQLADGGALLVDPTTGVTIELISSGEVHDFWDIMDPEQI